MLKLAQGRADIFVPAGLGTSSIKFFCYVIQRLYWTGGKAPIPKTISS